MSGVRAARGAASDGSAARLAGEVPEPNASNTHDHERAALEWRLARRALALALADPAGLGGVVLHGRHGPARDALLAVLRQRGPVRRIPPDADEEALVGGIDTTATLARGRTVHHTGLLDAPTTETLLVGGAERLADTVATRLRAWLDGEPPRAVSASLPSSATPPARAPLVVLDESLERSGLVESALGERLAMHVAVPELALAELRRVALDDGLGEAFGPRSDQDRTMPVHTGDPGDITLPEEALEELVRLAARFGIESMRSAALACRVARSNAWLEGRDTVSDADAALAAQLVLAPRARYLPDVDDILPQESAPSDETTDETPTEPPGESAPELAENPAPEGSEEPLDTPPPDSTPPDPTDEPREDTLSAEPLPERLVAAVAAALPRNLLEELAAGRAPRAVRAGRDARASAAAERGGRPIGTRRPRGGTCRRPDLPATLKAAIPHQRLRAREANDDEANDDEANDDGTTARPRLRVRRDDFRVTRRRLPTRTTTLFVVDASGSAAMHRLAEAKGAVESLLAECYVRRDRVALITFRGSAATLDLPPTRSLVRARRALIGLPGGGGTPLAAGLELAAEQLERLLREGETPVGVIMTDARANIARDGTPSRPEAQADAERAARRLGASGARLLFVDTGPRPRPVPQHMALLMGARYLPLPALDTAAVTAAGRAS